MKEARVMWRKFNNEKLYDLYASPNIVRVIELGRMRYARHMASMNKKKCVYTVLMGKAEVKKLFENPTLKLENNNKSELKSGLRYSVLDSSSLI
jgi:hypothetical protein